MSLSQLAVFLLTYPVMWIIARMLVYNDIEMYKNPITRSKVVKKYPNQPTDEQLYQMFLEQNEWEIKFFLLGYTFAGLLILLII